MRLELQEAAAEAFPAAEVGQVYVVLQPTPRQGRQGGALTFAVRAAEQLRLVGGGLDWRRCKAREHGYCCGTVVDGRRVDYCPKHRREATQVTS